MKCISFVGMDKPVRYAYRYRDRVCTAHIVQEALSCFFSPDEMVLLMSSQTYEKRFAEIKSITPNFRYLEIPEGRTEQELWDIFSVICDEVKEGDEVMFDITNSCRSLPFICFLSASYLKAAKGAKISEIVYGDVRHKNTGEIPIFDLTALAGIMDWVSGVRSFIRHADAEKLSSLIKKMQADVYREGISGTPPTHLIRWANSFEHFTAAVRLSRPIDALNAAEGIFHNIDEVEQEVRKFVPALLPVMDRIRSLEYLAAPVPDETGVSRQYAEKQLELIKYQTKMGLYLQAVTLAREVMVTIIMIKFGMQAEWLEHDLRHEIGRTLSGAALMLQKTQFETTEYSEKFETLENWKDMTRIWERVSDLRNDLAHCGMNDKEESLNTIQKRARRLPEDLELFLSMNFQQSKN